jgi:prepilin-type N-terminal cleavage/methylation domain-containing protein
MKNSQEFMSRCHCEPRRGAAIFFHKSEIASLVSCFRKKARGRKDIKGFTLIELVMVILITSVLSIAGIHLMKFTLGNSFYLPNQVQADLVAADALEIMVEGDSAAKGLRFCKAVTTAGTNSIVVTNQDDQTITYNLSGGVLTRQIALGAATQIPYFMAADMTLSGVGGTLFAYYDATNTALSQPVTAANVRRINIDLIAKNGTGSSDKYEGFSQQSSSVKVNKYL